MDAAVLVLLLAAAGLGSMLLGQDANWDLQNYHYYNPWAWWHGRIFDWDVAAAQIQTYHNPLPDLPFFGMMSAGWPPRVTAFVLAVPAALTGFFLFRLASVLLSHLPRTERAIAVACIVATGMTSAIGLGVLANTMNEWPLAMLVTFALWWLVRGIDAGGPIARRVLLVAGGAVGLATGAKLPAATFAVALGIAVLLRSWPPRWREGTWFMLGAGLGFAVAYGPWGYELWTHFGNPFFPYGNAFFRSPWWETQPVPGHDFGPHSLPEFLLSPFTMWDPPRLEVAEVPYRDGRLAVLWSLAWIALATRILLRTRSRDRGLREGGWRVIGIVCIVSFFAWTAAFSIYRYLLPLDVLSGLGIAGLLLMLLPRRIAVAALAACTIGLVATTRIADWGRVPFGERWFETKSMPIVEPDGLVLITTGEAVAYLIPLLPPSSRYLGALNTLVRPDQTSGLAQEVRDLVRNHKGEFYQMTHPLTEGQEVVEMHGLERTSACAVIVTNMPVSPIEFCRLVRKGEGP
ncbi:MAG: hypothetical protein U1F41_08835 [Burkholderiales bacterium]